MESYETNNIPIEVGMTYKNREGVEMTVIEKITENEYHVVNKEGLYHYKHGGVDYGNGYIVTKFGCFVTYPNPFDLIVRTV
jgi:Xaa-Pro aminopeptidase